MIKCKVVSTAADAFFKLSCGFMTLPILFHLRALTRISLRFLKSLQL